MLVVEAQELLREEEASGAAAARERLKRAHEFEPDWAVPARLLDDLERADLLGVDALARHLERARADSATTTGAGPAAAVEHYLAGRLQGSEGEASFQSAVRADPELAWGWHGLSVLALQRGEALVALDHARHALALAPTSLERSQFTANVARCLVAANRRKDALDVVEQRLLDPEVNAHDRRALELQVITLGLEASVPRVRSASFERALALLARDPLSTNEVRELVAQLRLARVVEGTTTSGIESALATFRTPARDAERAELLLRARPSALALALLEREAQRPDSQRSSRAAERALRFAAGDPRTAVEYWLAGLPTAVKDDQGLPREPRQRAIVELARRWDADLGLVQRGAATKALGEALLAAGWFRDARALASTLGASDLDAALDLDARAVAGLDILDGVRALFARVDAREKQLDPGLGPVARSEPEREKSRTASSDLDRVLERVARLLSRARARFGRESTYETVRAEMLGSPRMRYFGVAELVHPGPVFSAVDEHDGLGKKGDSVGGLSAELDRLGRFALFGEVTGGGGPDATVLPLLAIEERSGQHLGVRWSGTVAWCEEADVKSRAGRRGARISGAALHEGYWIDVDAVREELNAWETLTRRFESVGGAEGSAAKDAADAAARERIEKALAVRGLALEPGERLRDQRSRLGSPLGASDRIMLAILRSRASGAELLGRVTFDEMLAVTARHEEGHLCDRARFLPLGKNWSKLLRFLFDCGFAPARVNEELEYRAELVCLCVSEDARIPLAHVFDSAEGGSRGLTPHAGAYARLARDFLRTLDSELERDPSALASIDRQHTLVHQLHWLTSDEIRRVGTVLAREKDLVE